MRASSLVQMFSWNVSGNPMEQYFTEWESGYPKNRYRSHPLLLPSFAFCFSIWTCYTGLASCGFCSVVGKRSFKQACSFTLSLSPHVFILNFPSQGFICRPSVLFWQVKYKFPVKRLKSWTIFVATYIALPWPLFWWRKKIVDVYSVKLNERVFLLKVCLLKPFSPNPCIFAKI